MLDLLARTLLASALAAAAAVGAGPASAWEITEPVCIDDALLDPNVVKDLEIPLGCELIDCCTDCPAGAPLDWQVTVEGKAVSAAQLRFEKARPRVDGAGRASERGVQLEVGTTRLYGLPPSPREGPASSAQLTVSLDPRVLAALDERSPGAAAADVVRVAVVQRLDGVVVNDFDLGLTLSSCKAQPQTACDRVVQHSNTGADASVIQLDGRAPDGSCLDDAIFRATAAADVGDVKLKGSCAEEVVVYSAGNALALLGDPAFQDPCGDEADVSLQPLLEAPVHVWLSGTNAPSLFGGGVDLAGLAAVHVDKAIQLYDENKTGISFDATVKPLPGTIGGVASLALACTGIFKLPGVEEILAALQISPAYVPGEFNVYYLDLGIFSFTGANCSTDRNVIFVSSAASETTLAHEFGHAFSMHGDESTGGHTNGHAGFGEENLMWVNGGSARTQVSLGQAFRMSLDSASLLNVNGVRSGPTRSCPLLSSGPACPPLARDWVRP